MLQAIFLCTLFGQTLAQQFDCLTDQQRAEAALYARLQQEAYAALDRRATAFEELKTSQQIRQHQQKLREFFVQQLGGFPERSPLNAQTVRTIQAEGYRIECVIFDSLPNHRITANLYLPDVAEDHQEIGPVPGVVVSSGHSRTAKTADYNQRFGIMMAKHGMAALCFDPIGQGERAQVLDKDNQPFLGTTTEHFLVGIGSTLVGRSTARYRIWDAMRAIDYLASRPEVDSSRIGMTGCSGGGTLTSYVMALDDRVACAAPACYLTTFRRLIQTIGPQDAEQNIYGQISFGMDHPDYVLMRAPQPTLISSTTADFFDIQGSWNNYRQAKRIYGRMGFPERVDLVEIEGKHGVQPQNLATIAHWMQRWLLGRDQPVAAVELPTREPESLLCTKTGQVLTSLPGERSVFQLNAQYEQELADKRKERWDRSNERARPLGNRSNERARPSEGQSSHDELAAAIRRLLALSDRDDASEGVGHEDLGRVQRSGYHIDKLVLRPEGSGPLPGLTFHPVDPVDDAYLYLHDDGKMGDSQPGGAIEKIVSEGYAVVSIDLSGQGETSSTKRDKLLTDWKTYYLAYLLGKPLVGIRVEDTLAAADFVAHYQKKRDDPRKVHLVGVGQAGIVALHAAALRPDRFASVTLRNTPGDWSSIVSQSHPEAQLDSAVHAALTVYDLPDLVRLIGADKVRIEN